MKKTMQSISLALVAGSGLWVASTSFGYYEEPIVRPRVFEQDSVIKSPSIETPSIRIERNPGFGKLGKPVVPNDDCVIKSVSFGTSSVRSERDIIYGGDKLVVLPVDDDVQV